MIQRWRPGGAAGRTGLQAHFGQFHQLGRLVPQIAYYYAAYLARRARAIAASEKIHFVVPTGNFGNILAGYYACRMGCRSGGCSALPTATTCWPTSTAAFTTATALLPHHSPSWTFSSPATWSGCLNFRRAGLCAAGWNSSAEGSYGSALSATALPSSSG